MVEYTILCVDDEMSNLESLDRALRKDYKILSANSGPDAIKILKREAVHLIISDQRMPDMSGVEFLTQSIEICPAAIRILLTGFADLESVIDAINKGQIYRYLTKPWDPVELRNTVAQALDVYKMRETISQQNEELKKANDELKSLDHLKTDFMLLVNHELRTPLTAMTSYVQLLLEEKLTPEQNLYINRIQKNTDRLENLIQDTLLIMRMKSTNKKIEMRSLDIEALVKESWQKYSSFYPDADVKLYYRGKSPFVQMVNDELIRIIFNKLVRNAYQHTKEGTQVDISVDEDRFFWSLTTTNKTKKKIERTPEQLLNPFGKNEDILNHTGGAGLGLAVINSIVQLFNGSVDLKIDAEKFSMTMRFPKSL